MAALPRAFYARDAETVARELLGKVLVRRVDDAWDEERAVRRARITETEAYVGEHDLASHSSKGRTARNEAMFGPPGHAYVYLVYGVHHCLNVVTGKAGDGQAVLLRAAEPLDGWDADLRGPGRLARAFGLTRVHDKADLVRGALRVHDAPAPARIEATPRIGVGYAEDWAHAPLRFHDATSPHVSKRAHKAAPPQKAAPSGLEWLRRDRKARQAPPHGPSMPPTHTLAQQHCEPCNAKTPRIGRAEAERLALSIPGWRVRGGGTRLAREWTLKDFRTALALANEVGRIAEEEGHHPDLHLTDYKQLRVELSTHAIGGLSRNDFVLAAKIDQVAPASKSPRPARPAKKSA